MSGPLVVWIVEDVERNALDAWNVVQKVGSAFPGGVCIHWSMDFAWGQDPQLRKAIDVTLPPDVPFQYPDIVILDLCLQTETGVELRGDTFYDKLREREGLREGRKSFVIFWSSYLELSEASAFVRRNEDSDSRVIGIKTKRPEELIRTVSNLLRRVMDERER